MGRRANQHGDRAGRIGSRKFVALIGEHLPLRLEFDPRPGRAGDTCGQGLAGIEVETIHVVGVGDPIDGAREGRRRYRKARNEVIGECGRDRVGDRVAARSGGGKRIQREGAGRGRGVGETIGVAGRDRSRDRAAVTGDGYLRGRKEVEVEVGAGACGDARRQGVAGLQVDAVDVVGSGTGSERAREW